MIIDTSFLQTLQHSFIFAIGASVLAFLWAPLLTKFLYKYRITRRNPFDATLSLSSRGSKVGVPIMGGLLVIVTVALITFLFNWERRFTWMPIAMMLMAATLGGLDDLMNLFNEKKRRTRKIKHILRLIKVHKSIWQRIWLAITLPWAIFKRSSLWLGSHPGRGLHVHERLLVQCSAGAITAWWVFFKLGERWQEIHIPFFQSINIGWLIIPLIILAVMATANAVNFTDGMDGLAGGSMLITFTALSLLSWLTGYTEMAYLNATTAGALMTYTYFNIKPARFQMGDVGSLGLGALLAINTIVIGQVSLLPFFAFIFYVNLLSVIIQIAGRYLLGRRLFKMAPIHHHFELHGWSEEKTVMRFWIIHAAIVVIGLWVALY